MKKLYTTLVLLITTLLCTAQGYEFGIVNVSNYDFKIIAIPNFDSSGNTDVSDVGFTIILPAGMADAVNPTGLLTARLWTIQEFDAAFLTGIGLGDGTKDVFQFNLPPGQSILAHNSGDIIDLVSFQVTNMPTTGEMRIMLNTNPIAMGAGNVLDSFYNSNIDNTTTQDYYTGLALGIESFSFDTLGVENVSITENDIKIYPNPASEFIKIEANKTIDKIELYDLIGKRVLKTTQTNQIKINYLPNGIYLIKLFLDNKTITKKIVKN